MFFRCKKVQFLITAGDGKFYSNGMDQAFLMTCTTEEFLTTLNLVNNTILRLLTFPVLTVAALNGIVKFVIWSLESLDSVTTCDFVLRYHRG